jgi:hypothetical protein
MPAVSRFGAIACLTYVACWTGQATTPVATDLEPAARDVTGSYWCSFADGEYDDERQPCMIKKVGDKLVLAKLAGQERIRGHIVLDDKDGFTFVGELYCPWGDCNHSELHGRFKPVGRGGFKGNFREEAMVVHLTPAPAGSFGGSTYGGDQYGGDPFDYDGTSYGGDGYGGYRLRHRIDLRGRRRP